MTKYRIVRNDCNCHPETCCHFRYFAEVFVDDWVYEDVGEIADCDFYNVSKEAKEELQEVIQQWAEKHVKLPYWKVQNVVKKVVTQEDLE